MQRRHRLLGLVDIEFHAIEFLQQIVGKLDIGLIDLVDQQDDRLLAGEGLPQFAADDVVADVMHFGFAQLAIAQPGNGVIFIETLGSLGGRFDMPLDEIEAKRAGDFAGQHCFPGARLALDQQWPTKSDAGIDGDFQVAGGNIAIGSGKARTARAGGLT